jgi:heme exporter protein D
MRNLDFSSWQALLSTLVGLAVITLIGVGIRLLVMQTVQQRRERENRQINERLRTLIAAYKTLGGSFTGNLAVDPAHFRELRRKAEHAVGFEAAVGDVTSAESIPATEGEWGSSDRSRRIRDAVEAALSDIILLGTEEQVRLAATVATEMAAGRSAHTAELVVSLRDFIRQVLDLDPVPTHLPIPKQGPTRPSATRGGGKGEGGKDDTKQGGGKGSDMSAGGGMGVGMGLGGGSTNDDESDHHH